MGHAQEDFATTSTEEISLNVNKQTSFFWDSSKYEYHGGEKKQKHQLLLVYRSC